MHQAALPRRAWNDLLVLERDIFVPSYVPWDPPEPGAPPPPPPPICHPDTLIFGAADPTRQASTSWDTCSGSVGPETAFATELARLAVGTRRGCTFNARQPIAALQTCFAAPAAGS